MNKVKEFVVNNIASWIIEIAILGVVAAVAISEVRKTNEQTRAMLTAVSEFAAQYQGQAGKAVENVLDEVATINVEGDIDIKDIGSATKDLISDFLKKDDDNTADSTD